ncbi:MAG: TetR/AcrR family transcriptional regulator [Gammaproteobacteria bacterium]|nr:TetR/AcrR family transcriptional regulator [Gammaproteobacteria bacterium]
MATRRDLKDKPTRQWLAAPERRRQLLRVALGVAARRGLGRTGHAEVAKLAGVAVSSVFLYFPSRQELLTAIVAEIGRFYIELARGYHDAEGSPLAAVKAHLHGFADSVKSEPDYAQVWLEWAVLIRNDDGLWDAFLEFQETMIHIIAGSIERAQAAGEVTQALRAPDAARLVVASAYTLTQLQFMQRSAQEVHSYAEQALDLALSRV